MAAPPPSEEGGFIFSTTDFPSLSKASISGMKDKEGKERLPSPIKPKYAEKIRPPPHIPFNALPPIPDVVIKQPFMTTRDGLPAIVFAKEEIEASSIALKYCLVASFYGERPSVNVFDKYVNTEWGLNKTAVVGLMNPRQFLIRLQEESDYIHAWSRQVSTFNGARFQLFKWTPNFDTCKQKWKAVWLEFPYLPIEFQLPSFLKNIGNCIGKFLSLDERTRSGKHPIAPRICVELNVAQSLQNAIWVGSDLEDESIGFLQPIKYDFTRSVCTKCRVTGHEAFECIQGLHNSVKKAFSHVKNPTMVKTSKQVWVEKVSQSNSNIQGDSFDNTPKTHLPEKCSSLDPFTPTFQPTKGDNMETKKFETSKIMGDTQILHLEAPNSSILSIDFAPHILPTPCKEDAEFTIVKRGRNKHDLKSSHPVWTTNKYDLLSEETEQEENGDTTRAIVPYVKPLHTSLDYYEASKVFDELPRQDVIKMLQDSSQEPAEFLDARTLEHTKPMDQEVNSRTLFEKKNKHSAQPSLLDSIRKAAKSHIKVSSKAIRAEGNSFRRIEPGIKWGDIIDSEEEK